MEYLLLKPEKVLAIPGITNFKACGKITKQVKSPITHAQVILQHHTDL